MTRRFFDLAFTPSVLEAQKANGSAEAYGRLYDPEEPGPADVFGPDEAAFIAARDSFYMASVNEDGWPYVQHRGGPKGFVKVLDGRTFGIADFRGNRQYVSVGNIAADDRVSLFFMDYPNRRRLKVLARAKAVGADEAPGILARLSEETGGARVERGLLFRLEAYDWNCPQFITPRFTAEEWAAMQA